MDISPKCVHIKVRSNPLFQILGLVINSAYYRCGSCREKHYLFGSLDSARQTSQDLGSVVLGELALIPEISQLGDQGKLGDIFMGLGDLRDVKTTMEEIADEIMKRLKLS